MKTKLIKVAILFAAILLPQTSHASTFNYELQNLGLNQYSYTYTIGNDGTLSGGSSIQLFDILFAPSLYSEASLSLISAPSISTTWSEQFLASAPGVPAAYDVLANSLGIAVGSQVSGFSVSFIYLGAGLPGNQGYEIYDPVSFNLLEIGNTQPVNNVPLPGALPLFITALLGLGTIGKSFRPKHIS